MYVINDFNGEEIIEAFYEKEFQKTNQKEFKIKKGGDIDKETLMSFGGDINVKVDLANYATKTDLKNETKLIHLN